MAPPLEDNMATQKTTKQQDSMAQETPEKNLPEYTLEEVALHNAADSLWVVRSGKVYDITKFAKIHPGGSQILVDYGGEEVGLMMDVSEVHKHSIHAYKMMGKYHIGNVENYKEENKWYESADYATEWDLKKEPIDWTKPMLKQVGQMGGLYNTWAHTPVNEDVRLYESDISEFFSRFPWYGVPFFWGSLLLYNLCMAYSRLGDVETTRWMGYDFDADYKAMAFMFCFGGMTWTLWEYALHRWIFHWEPPADSSPFVIETHFLFAGLHHKTPMDPTRLVFPPLPAFIVYIPLTYGFHAMLPYELVHVYLSGMVVAFMSYDLVHYYCHHGRPARDTILGRLQQMHMKHHYVDYNLGFGLSSKFWDIPFHTDFPETGVKSKTK